MIRFQAARWIAIALCAAGAARFCAGAPPLPAQVDLPSMKTSIYLGSVRLITSTFVETAGSYSATYEAKVSPWSWWSESGTVALTITPEDYERLLRGETVELSGEATNHKGKLRQVTARAQPADATTGRIKVRITASGTTLVFNSSYSVTPGMGAAASVAAPAPAVSSVALP